MYFSSYKYDIYFNFKACDVYFSFKYMREYSFFNRISTCSASDKFYT